MQLAQFFLPFLNVSFFLYILILPTLVVLFFFFTFPIIIPPYPSHSISFRQQIHFFLSSGSVSSFLSISLLASVPMTQKFPIPLRIDRTSRLATACKPDPELSGLPPPPHCRHPPWYIAIASEAREGERKSARDGEISICHRTVVKGKGQSLLYPLICPILWDRFPVVPQKRRSEDTFFT